MGVSMSKIDVYMDQVNMTKSDVISSWDGPAKSTEKRQGRKHTRRLPCYKTLVENKYEKITLNLLHIYAADVG